MYRNHFTLNNMKKQIHADGIAKERDLMIGNKTKILLTRLPRVQVKDTKRGNHQLSLLIGQSCT